MIKKILFIIVILSQMLFAMGVPVKDTEVVNNTDPWHQNYEIVPFRIEGVKFTGPVFALPNNKVLIYQYDTELFNENQYLETIMIYDLKNESIKYLCKNKKVEHTAYDGIMLSNGKTFIKRGYNKLGVNNRVLEIFNPETEIIEYSLFVTRDYEIIGELKNNKILLSDWGYYFFDPQEKIITEYFPKFADQEYIPEHEGTVTSETIRWHLLFFNGALLYFHEDKEMKSLNKQLRILGKEKHPDRNKLYVFDEKSGRYKQKMVFNYYGGTRMLTEDKFLFFNEGNFQYNEVELVDISNNRQVKLNGRTNEYRDTLMRYDLVLLDDGNVLITSGDRGTGTTGAGYGRISNASVEMYIVSEDRFVLFKTRKKNMRRESVKLSNGDVLIYDRYGADIFRRKPSMPATKH